MTDLQSTLDAIDQLAVHECGQCQRPLGPHGASLDFCSPLCQSAWLQAEQEIVNLVGYREPEDLPHHVYNLVELSSTETTSPTGDLRYDRERSVSSPSRSQVFVRIVADVEPMQRAFADFVHGLGEFMREHEETLTRFAQVMGDLSDWQPTELLGAHPTFSIVDEIGPIGVVINSLRVTAPEPEIVLEMPDEPPFGSDFDFEWTPATSLPSESPPAVMPSLPARDWQAVVDRASAGGYWTPDSLRSHVERSIGRRR